MFDYQFQWKKWVQIERENGKSPRSCIWTSVNQKMHILKYSKMVNDDNEIHEHVQLYNTNYSIIRIKGTHTQHVPI